MPHMATSPFRVNGLVDGQADGARDCELVARCPSEPPEGMDVMKAWSARYQRGYSEAFSNAEYHRCGPECGRS